MINIVSEVEYETIRTGDKSAGEYIEKYQYLGYGVVRIMKESFTNNFPDLVEFDLTYQGVIPLKEQSLFVNRRFISTPTGAKSIESLDFDFSEGSKNGSAKYTYGEYSTKTEKSCALESRYPGSTINDSIEGMISGYKCDSTVNGVYVLSYRYAYFENYKISYLLETKNNQYTTTIKLKSFQVLK